MIVIDQIIQIMITTILFTKGRSVLLTAFNLLLRINSFWKIRFTNEVKRDKNIMIITTEVVLSTNISIYTGVFAK